MTYAVAVDIGGTFTDLVAYDHAAQKVIYAKSPTTYENLVEGILDCFKKARVKAAEATLVNHGTTLVINSLIQRKGAKTALVTSKGFRDILEIARGNRPDPFDLHYQRDEPLIPRELRLEVPERTGSKGEVVNPLDVPALETLAGEIRKLDVESVAVFFMNSYVNPSHEEAAAEILRERLPDVYITFSTDLTHEWYEYERCSTVAANAYVGPQVSTYVRRLDSDLKAQGFTGSLFMMGSNGGLLSAERTCRQPIGLVESGPIGGCIGASAYAEALGFKNVVAFDMGGTTAKSALVENGRFSVNSVYYVGGYVRGFPIKSSVIDVVEVGSGGGSIAWLDSQKRLHVGPQSAGSTPGPVCYGRGGSEPTITDANLVLGRLNADNFLGGEMKLDVNAAERDHRGTDRPAAGLHRARRHDPDGRRHDLHRDRDHGRSDPAHLRGAWLDPRDFVLFSYGGGGPLHACALAHELSIPTWSSRRSRETFRRSACYSPMPGSTRQKPSSVCSMTIPSTPSEENFGAMEKDSLEALAAEFGTGDVFFERHAEMRYRGQRHNIKVPVSGLKDAAAIRDAFEHDYRRRYGHADAKAPAEFQALHLSAFARFKRPDIARLPRPAVRTQPSHTRRVYLGGAGGWIDAQIFNRDTLQPGFNGVGPAVIEEYGSTTVVWPGDRFEIGALHEIRIQCSSG